MADGPTGVAEPTDPPPPPRPRGRWRELPAIVGIAVLLAVAIKLLVVQAYFIPSSSMVPTLREGDRILVCRICLRLDDVDRGDVIVFEGPDGISPHRGVLGGALHWLGETLGVASPPHDDFVKRVAGLPGDTVEIDRTGALFVDGEPVDEPYLNRPVPTDAFPPTAVPDGMLFVLGDNRGNSGDSRCQPPDCTGLVPVDKVIGVTILRLWPPQRIGVVR
ncbi:MAG: signal peptidase I [Actinomycetota bacterium]|nr:signal peptidase I [Actinomycetota bacterium]MDH5223609.1 signal peptidase I [Actinomycetota bacterium]MDH5313616.1 signal peptidase I [Actinomycetota bacterium]